MFRIRGGIRHAVIVTLAAGAVGPISALAQETPKSASAGGDFEITHSVFANGGGRASGGEFELTATIGQPIADAVAKPLRDGGYQYQMVGGFRGRLERDGAIFRDGYESSR